LLRRQGAKVNHKKVYRLYREVDWPSPRKHKLPKGVMGERQPLALLGNFDQWTYCHGVKLKLMQSGKPIQNGYVESFNGKFRDGCLNEN